MYADMTFVDLQKDFDALDHGVLLDKMKYFDFRISAIKCTCTCPCAYRKGGVKGGEEMLVFRNIWRALFSSNTRFEIHPFTLLPTNE